MYEPFELRLTVPRAGSVTLTAVSERLSGSLSLPRTLEPFRAVSSAVVPTSATATGGRQVVVRSEFSRKGAKSMRVPTESPLPGPLPAGPLAAPHQLQVASTLATDASVTFVT